MNLAKSKDSFGHVFGIGLALLLSTGVGCDRPGPKAADAASATNHPNAGPVVMPLTNMVAVKAGSFMRQQQKVTITHDFWIGKYEVTQAEFSSVSGKNPSH